MLKGILAIAGQPGLYKVLSEGKNKVIIESLLTGKKSTAYTDAKMSTLEDIAIYTLQEDIPLKEVFRKIYEKENGGQAMNVKSSSPDELKKYFAEILPEYDKERVYGSDVKKVISWYNLLNEKGLIILDEEKADENLNDEKSGSEEV